MRWGWFFPRASVRLLAEAAALERVTRERLPRDVGSLVTNVGENVTAK
jgi:hypothetical protein